MPFVFLFKLPGILREYDGEVTYSRDGKKLLKVADNCKRVKVRKGVEVIASKAFDSTRVTHVKPTRYCQNIKVQCSPKGTLFGKH